VALRSLVALFFAQRAVPIAASVVVHASVAAALVAGSGGHAKAGTGAAEAFEVDLVTTPAPDAPPIVEETPPPETKTSLPSAPFPTHTHPYPVDPSHDAHPHDPSLHHDEATPPDHDHDHDQAAPSSEPAHAEPAAAAPALVATGSTLPKFDLSAGSGAPTGVRVAGSGSGSGALSGAGTGPGAGGDEVVHAASSVQVSARLVQSVVAAYPVHARADEVEGDVGVEIVVDREGRVIDARVTRPAGHGFDEAALVAVRAYRFSPAQREGRPVRVRMPWSVQFRLR